MRVIPPCSAVLFWPARLTWSCGQGTRQRQAQANVTSEVVLFSHHRYAVWDLFLGNMQCQVRNFAVLHK